MNWKDHPVVIAAIAAVAGVAFAVQFLSPALNAQLNHEHQLELSRLSTQISSGEAELSTQQAENKKLTIDLDTSINEVQSLQSIISSQAETIEKLQMGRIFDFANPYPVGFQQIHLLDSLSKVDQLYDESQIDKTRPGYWMVKVEHALFDRVGYYYDLESEDSENPIIYQISYSMRDFKFENISAERHAIINNTTPPARKAELSDHFLVNLLNEALGSGLSWDHGEEKVYAWTTPYELTVYITPVGHDRFIIALEGLAPGSWRHPIPTFQTGAMCTVD